MKRSSGPATPSDAGMAGWRKYAGLAALCALVLGVMAAGITGAWDIDGFDRTLTDQVPGLRTDWLTTAMLVVSALGDARYLSVFGVVVVLTLLARRAWRPAAGVALAYSLLPIMVRLIKGWVVRPRPTVDLYGGVEAFSFPSGHAANAMMIYGGLAVLTWMTLGGRRRVVIAGLLALLVVSIAVSRVYLGAHWPSDTLAGLAVGGVMLTALAACLHHPATPAVPRAAPVTSLCVLCLTGPVYALLTLPAARVLYHALG
ncbi:phosphatase PAP2 family protein [Hyphomonas johnsonii]|uniref:PA-phosphatase-like phosphoesterase n=1 Tax=Hyphomonas johnsonii MHS-2 TaxID=1280950 RepID=A0A059FN80_9PROT|nr:phosphatase PAP2 family protein [Hyphomonas johnsonii]KCZ92084.1 PA-phosphatase-like phosphoesterase [Hyphomonas johnsonii MHS-2]